MERWVAKLIAGTILFLVPLICTVVPIRMSAYFEKKGKEGKVILSRLMCFGGGVFFSTFLLHMIPEVQLLLKNSLLKPNGIKYHVSEVLIGVGFFLVLFIETLANKGYHRSKDTSTMEVTELGHSDEPSGKEGNNHVETENDNKEQIDCWRENNDVMHNNVWVKQESVNNSISEGRALLSVPSVNTAISVEFSGPSGAYTTAGEAHHSSRALVLALALSLHRIFEGMSIGLKDSLISVWSMFLAVISHEAVIAFSLGLQLMANRTTLRRNLIYATICSVVMPIGISIGTLLIELGESGHRINVVNGVLQAISSGTFIYVTFFEILHDEFDHDCQDLSKVFSLMVGFALMAAINAIPEKEDFIAIFDIHNTTLTPLVPYYNVTCL